MLDDYEYNITTDYKSIRSYTVLRWTTTPPTVEGWYWVIYKSNKVIMYFSGEDWYFSKEDTKEYMYYISPKDITHFLGPLPVPEPPQ